MTDCYFNEYPGSQLSLEFFCQPKEHSYLELAINVLDIFDEFKDVVQPLSIELDIDYLEKNTLWRKYGVNPPLSN